MMTTARKKLLTSDMVTETRFHHFVTEASTLELAPGVAPRTIPTSLGNRQPFVLTGIRKDTLSNEEFVVLKYRQQLGCITLTVFDD